MTYNVGDYVIYHCPPYHELMSDITIPDEQRDQMRELDGQLCVVKCVRHYMGQNYYELEEFKGRAFIGSLLESAADIAEEVGENELDKSLYAEFEKLLLE